jgi:hypothetical protein
MFVALSLLQGYCWHWRPEPEWRPGWWQVHAWAEFGAFLGMVGMIPLVILRGIGMTSPAILGWLAIIVGFGIEFGIAFFSTSWIVNKVLKYATGAETHNTAA